jgi:hypothetical protein
MPRLAALLLLLASCSSEPTDDALDDEGGSSGDSGGVGTEGDDAADDGASSGGEESEGGSTGEPEPVWPPECVEEGTCGAIEGLTDAGACVEQGLEVTGVELAWGMLEGTGDVIEASIVTGECGEPLRWVYTEPAYLNAYRLSLTWTSEAATWRCDMVRTDIEAATVEVGDLGQLEITGPYAFPSAASDCCLLSGAAPEDRAQTPC